MIYDVKPGAKLQRNPQISKSFMLKYPRISKSFMPKYPQISKSFMPKYPRISKSLAFRTKNKYFPQGLVEVAEQVETSYNKEFGPMPRCEPQTVL